MRTIKFRGFGVWSDCKKWFYGDLTHYANGKLEIIEYRNNIRSENYEVDKKSIGQFTGLHDKNGKEIYEGDILSNDEVEGEVYYSNRGTWDCESFILGGINEKSKVIGNIYQNPELIKEVK